jgi:hypothetical protein
MKLKSKTTVIALSILALCFLFGAEEKQDMKKETEKEEKNTIVPLNDKTKDMQGFEGLFDFYQDTTSGSIFMLIEKEQIGKEFIYFVQSVNGIVDVRFNRGSLSGKQSFFCTEVF